MPNSTLELTISKIRTVLPVVNREMTAMVVNASSPRALEAASERRSLDVRRTRVD